ncbi:MAG TPA: type I restriction enzyme HsdR N-terminal domain-containing protein [Gemmatimonadales bacterium]|nr:type I restriction enzyme HsdR N-terminal domain-containing protein [Gemmatimonadales bacterium]
MEKGGKYFVHCRIRNKLLHFKPEEVVRQREINRIIDGLAYPSAQVKVEVPITMGSTVHDKPADIVVYSDPALMQPWIIVETKKPNRKDGIEQLKSYMNPTGATFGLWSNGLDERPILRSGANDFTLATTNITTRTARAHNRTASGMISPRWRPRGAAPRRDPRRRTALAAAQQRAAYCAAGTRAAGRIARDGSSNQPEAPAVGLAGSPRCGARDRQLGLGVAQEERQIA